MEEKKTIILDLTDCKYLGELHERIRTAFDFPEWYGANLDAFWDLLSSECDADEVILTGVNTMPRNSENTCPTSIKFLTEKPLNVKIIAAFMRISNRFSIK